jgi:AraC-like DNA-binding protein
MMNSSDSLKLAAARALDVCSFTGPARRVMSRQKSYPAHQLIVVTGGVYMAGVDSECGRETIRAEAGDVVLWPERMDHTDQSVAGRPLHCIVVWLEWPLPALDLPFQVRDADHVIDLLAHRLLMLAHEPARKTVLGAEADAFVSAILAEFVLRARTAEDELLSKVARYTEEHINGPIRLADLARAAGLEKHHFGRKYKQLTNRTPMQDVKRRKAAYAKHILQLSPGRTLRSILSLVGVKDAATLSRLLSRYAGASARDIKRAARAKR